ncbi:MAG: ADP-glyceromanno-heptose 6-epimerase [Bacteroidetes bacterium]|nr:MAG: ADP-glyceromanno-heptose 6-epimerase [Bacteroidota bacterium]
MIIVTGAAGFIGSCLVGALNEAGHLRDIIAVDDFYNKKKDRNLDGKFIRDWIHRDIFPGWFDRYGKQVTAVFHLGARTDTTEKDAAIFDRLNLNYSKRVWEICAKFDIPLVYASSAATYGMGEHGFRDAHDLPELLRPLNPYGRSKNDFDKWALAQKSAPPFWAGLKFFNVFGPNEYHKGRMASVVFHTFRQIVETGQMKLFRSHHPDFKDGEQRRDFIYVKDVVRICLFLLEKQPASGLYNVGTGEARTFFDLATAVFRAMDRTPEIRFVDTPEDIRETYQYFTQADIGKLRRAGYEAPFYALESGVEDYVKNYLAAGKYF